MPTFEADTATQVWTALEPTLNGVVTPATIEVAAPKVAMTWTAKMPRLLLGSVPVVDGVLSPPTVYALDAHVVPRFTTQITEGQGGWLIWLSAPGHYPVEVSLVRGVATKIGELSDEDPFTWTDTTLTFPGLSLFDRVGVGELAWLREGADVNIEWTGPLPDDYPYEAMVYEGFVDSFDYADDGIEVSVKGAMYQQDHIKAKPEHLAQPLPYEVAIARQFAQHVSSRLRPFAIEWPSWWTTVYTPKARVSGAFIPTGVKPGDYWTNLLTRETGKWEESLNSYIRTLLGGMWTERGRWSLDLLPGRQPVMRHRSYVTVAGPQTIIIDPASPGVSPKLTEDWSQTANVFYGQGKGIQGQAFSGMEVTHDGQRTFYRPLAALRQVDPTTDDNGWLQPERMRREQVMEVQEGLDRRQAEQVAAYQLRQFAEPGLVGTITLKADVKMSNGQSLAHWCVRSGMTAQLPGALGSDTGVFLHIVKVTRNLDTGDVVLTVDSKYRDCKTVDEVMMRGRDSLSIPRKLIGGLYVPPLPDLLVPWSYAEGSGYFPSGAGYSSVPLFEDMPGDIVFPWEEWTVQRPPGESAWRNCYIKIGPASNNADNNWAVATSRGNGKYGFPIRMSQAGQIRLLQIAAYDLNGNVLQVPFHVSIYSSNGVGVAAMPKIPSGTVDGYAAGQHYPFFEGAFETFSADGSQVSTEVTKAVSSAGLVRGWGTGEVKAGYWPGSSLDGDPTGLLVDEEQWAITVPTGDGSGDWGINPYSTKQAATYAGFMYAMIYCDQQGTEPVFFMGRAYRAEPGEE